MPRKSKEALEAAKVHDIGRLPEPPADFNEEKAALWHSIVATKPSDWWDASNLPLLRALVVHEFEARKLDVLLEELSVEAIKKHGVDVLKELTAMRQKHTSAMATLTTKMRLSQQSRYERDRAATVARRATEQKSAAPSRPWAS